MLIALTFAAALAGQTPPPASARGPEIRRDVRVVTVDGPDGPGAGRPDLDKNGDGFVTREEFTGPQNAAFDLLDGNKDGRISTEEFAAGRAAAHAILGGPDGPGGPGGRFRIRMDGPGGSGPMGDGEVRVFTRGGPVGAGGPGANFTIHTRGGPDGPGDLDTDHDGKVSEAEFLAPVREAFQRLDADRSGSLEAGEHGPGGDNVVIVRAGPGGRAD
jgi:hypothetical protein